MPESALYQPVKDWLEEQEFMVRAEVQHCDVAAMRGQELWVVELKTRLNLEVILQAVDRQRVAQIVYIAIPVPKRGTRHAARVRMLLRQLGIGLLEVSSRGKRVSLIVEAKGMEAAPPLRQAKAKRGRLEREFHARQGDYNCGGVTGVKLMTAYRQESLRIAMLLQGNSLSPKQLRSQGAHPKKTCDILRRNYYGWFERVKKGIYTLTPQGEKALEAYADMVSTWRHADKTEKEQE